MPTQKRYDYKIFPQSITGRVLLALAFGAGLLFAAGYFALFILGPFGLFNVFNFGGWWDKFEVTYVNRTDETIAVFVEDDLEVTIPAGSESTVSYRKFEWLINRDIHARTLDGRLISATTLDEGDLEDLDYRVVFDGSGAIDDP